MVAALGSDLLLSTLFITLEADSEGKLRELYLLIWRFSRFHGLRHNGISSEAILRLSDLSRKYKFFNTDPRKSQTRAGWSLFSQSRSLKVLSAVVAGCALASRPVWPLSATNKKNSEEKNWTETTENTNTEAEHSLATTTTTTKSIASDKCNHYQIAMHASVRAPPFLISSHASMTFQDCRFFTQVILCSWRRLLRPLAA